MYQGETLAGNARRDAGRPAELSELIVLSPGVLTDLENLSTLAGEGGDPSLFDGGTNRYSYTRNDPINFSDPSGLDPCDCSQQKLVGLNPDLIEGVNYNKRDAVKLLFTPDFADRVSAQIRLMNSWGVVPQINDAYRTHDDQLAQWTRYKTRDDLKACNPDSTLPGADVCRHQLGNAVDINVRTKIDGEWFFNPDFGLIVAAMIENGFQWGGYWDDHDWVHFENWPAGTVQQRRELARQLEDYFNKCVK